MRNKLPIIYYATLAMMITNADAVVAMRPPRYNICNYIDVRSVGTFMRVNMVDVIGLPIT